MLQISERPTARAPPASAFPAAGGAGSWGPNRPPLRLPRARAGTASWVRTRNPLAGSRQNRQRGGTRERHKEGGGEAGRGDPGKVTEAQRET